MSALPSPWAGETFAPATPLDIATIEGAIVTQLQAALAAALGSQMIEVTHFPDKPEAYEMRHRIGVAMVIYVGGDYGEILDIGHVAQERTMEFDIGIRIRDLGWAFGGPASGTSPGAYQILEQIRLALTGFQPNRGCTKLKPLHERFLDRDKQGGVWVYSMRFATRSVAVENYSEPNFPLFSLGTVQEEGKITLVNAGLNEYTFSGQGTIQLAHGNISNVVVSNPVNNHLYTLGYRLCIGHGKRDCHAAERGEYRRQSGECVLFVCRGGEHDGRRVLAAPSPCPLPQKSGRGAERGERCGGAGMRKIIQKLMKAGLVGCALLIAACATQGSGLTFPLKINGQNVLVNSAAVLAMESAQTCNAAAQVEYNLSTEVCSGAAGALIPVQTAQANAAIALLCGALGYTNGASNQLVVPPSVALGNCSAAVTPSPAPSPAPIKG